MADRKAEGVLNNQGAARAGDRRETRGLAQRRAQEANRVRLRHAGDCGRPEVCLEEVSWVRIGRDTRETGQSIIQLGHLSRRLADGQRGAGLHRDDGSGLAEKRPNRLVGGRGEGRTAQQDKSRAINDAISGGGSQRAGLDDGGTVVAAETRKRHAAVASLDEVTSTRDLTRVSRIGRLVNRDGTTTEFDARVGVAREVVDRLGRVIETNGGLAAARAGVEYDI